MGRGWDAGIGEGTGVKKKNEKIESNCKEVEEN